MSTKEAMDLVPETRSQRKGRQIVMAASRLFREQGYGATSMEAIAREAGVSKATLYAHYKSKDELFAAMIALGCRRHTETLTALQDARAEIRPETIRPTLIRTGREHVGLLLSPEGVAAYRVVIAETPRFPELGRAFFDSGVRINHSRLVEYLTRAAALGFLKIDQPRRAAGEFLGMVGSYLQLHAMLGLGDEFSAAERDACIEHAVDTFLRAYRP